MGQKVNPVGIRLGITRDWGSKWFAGTRGFPGHVYTDHVVRELLRHKLADAIGKKGEDIEKLRIEVAKVMRMPVVDLRLNIAEIRKPELDAQLVAEGIAQQLEKRVMFRRAMNREGRIPLHTFRADIDYGLAEAKTTYGVIGVKAWIFKGEIFEKPELEMEAQVEGEEKAAAEKPATDKPVVEKPPTATTT
jgi:small subunit ribosomal protein S3